MIIMCRDCEQTLHEECGIYGHEIYYDSYCGECKQGECDTCKYKNCCPIDDYDKRKWGII